MIATLAAAPVTTGRMTHKGRPAVTFDYLSRTLVIVVTLPKACDRRYLVNEWDVYGADAVTEFDNRRDALEFAAIAAEKAAGPRRANVAAGLGNVAVTA